MKNLTTGAYKIFRGLNFEPDAEIEQKGLLCKGLEVMTCRSAGYTLIELVVVVAILGMLLGFAVPRIAERLFTSDEDSTAKWLKTETARLRTKAQQTQMIQILRVDLNGQQFFLEPENDEPTDAETPQKAALKLADGIQLDQVLLGKDSILTDNQAPIRFFPDGAADLTIFHMSDKTGHRFTWIIEPFLTTIAKMEEHGQYTDYWQ